MKALLILGIFVSSQLAFGQEWGKITFYNRRIPTAAGGQTGGGNGDGTYDVGLWSGSSPNVGAGSFPGAVTVGLFLPASYVPLATTTLRTRSFTEFFASTQDVAIPGMLPGQTTTLVVRAWQGPDFLTARNSGYTYRWGEWVFDTKPLGGTTPAGAQIPVPMMTGWGTEDGLGYVLPPYYLSTFVEFPTDGMVFAAPATVKITADWFIEDISATNFSLFANGTLLKSATPTATIDRLTVTAGPFGAGSYKITTTLKGPADLRAASAPVNITVVEPVALAIDSPRIAGGWFGFNYSVNPGLKYLIESSTDFLNWQPIMTNTPVASPAQFVDGSAAGERRFYRVNRLANP